MAVTWTLKFEVSPDKDVGSGAPSGETANGRITYGVPASSGLPNTLDDFTTLGATPPTYNWTLRSYDITAWFNPVDTRIAIERLAGDDSIHVRRFRVEGSDGRTLYGGWPQGFGHYDASHQDGLLGREYLGQDIGVGVSDFRGEQFSLETLAYENPSQTLDWYFVPIFGPTVGYIGSGVPTG